MENLIVVWLKDGYWYITNCSYQLTDALLKNRERDITGPIQAVQSIYPDATFQGFNGSAWFYTSKVSFEPSED